MNKKKSTNSNLWNVFSTAISFLAILISGYATFVAFEAKNINKDALGIQLDQISQEYAAKAYDELYYNPDNAYVVNLLKNDSYVKDLDVLKRVVDVFEGIGSGACQGIVKFRHIRPYLGKTLKIVCDNNQILDNYGGSKNGVAMLCHELYPDSFFAETIDLTNISTCEYWDSLKIPQTMNRERFQTK